MRPPKRLQLRLANPASVAEKQRDPLLDIRGERGVEIDQPVPVDRAQQIAQREHVVDILEQALARIKRLPRREICAACTRVHLDGQRE
jgi:hypothetical protein